ncbi:MAG: putative ABC transporter permease subunit, partial [Peptostreptococcaceae bacterium]
MDLLLLIGFIGAVLFSLFTTLYKSSSYLFEARDFEMLISLPIKESTILVSKIFMLLISNYLFTAPFIFITGIVYAMKMDMGIIYYINLVLMFLCIPLIPMMISSVVSFLLGSISSKMRFKNAVLIIGSIVLLVGYLGIVSQLETIGKTILENSSSIIEGVKKIYFMSFYYVEGLVNTDLLSTIKFITISFGLFIIFSALFGKQYRVINGKMKESYKVNKYEEKELKTSNVIQALFEKEVKRYLSSYIYVLNTSVGMIMLMVFTGGLVIFGADKVSQILQLNLDLTFMKVQILGVILFCVVMTCTTYCSISLEGKNLWIVKSLPIKEMDIFKSKIKLNLLMNMPISIICFLMISFKMKFEPNFIIVGSLVIGAMAVLIALLGLYLNLLYPNLDWKNEVAVVKRSFSMIAVMLFSLVYVGLFGFIYFKFNIMNVTSFLVVPVVSTLILILVIWNLLKTKGIEMFRKIG